jgi:MFS family permease
MTEITLDPRRRWALALLCGAFFMVILDASIVFVALPSIGADLGFSEQGLQWVVSAYALTFAGLLLLGGRAADLRGRRRVVMAGVALFTATSLLCGLAWSPAALIAARTVQGVGAAIMTPTALSIISTMFPEGPRAEQGARDLGLARRPRRHRGVADRRPASTATSRRPSYEHAGVSTEVANECALE